MIKDLPPNQWQALNEWLTKPLDDAGKALVLDMVDWPLTEKKLEQFYPTKTPAEIQKELVAFKETSQKLIPQIEKDVYQKGYYLKSRLPSDNALVMQEAYKALSSDAKKIINNELWLMLRTINTEQLHPCQYHTAARLALELIELQRGRPKEDGYPLYRLILCLWRDLGETNLKCGDNPMTPIVGFSHNLFLIIDSFTGDHTQAPSTIRQELPKHIKRFSVKHYSRKAL